MFRKESANLPDNIVYQASDRERTFSTYIINEKKYQRQPESFFWHHSTRLFHLEDSEQKKSPYIVKVALASRLEKEFKNIPKPFKKRYKLLQDNNKTRLLQIDCGIPFLEYLQNLSSDLFGLAALLESFIELFKTLKVLYSNGYLHGDLHAGQILYQEGTINLIDFESSRRHSPSKNLPREEIQYLKFTLMHINSILIKKWYLYIAYLESDFFYNVVNFITCDKTIEYLTPIARRIQSLAQEKFRLKEADTKLNTEQKSREFISCAEFSNIIEDYNSSSNLTPYLGPFRSSTIRNMRELFIKDTISKKDVLHAIPFWDQRRRNLFNGKSEEALNNGTDSVIKQLRKAYI